MQIASALHSSLQHLAFNLQHLAFTNVYTATWIAVGVVPAELAGISWNWHRFTDTPWSSAAVQVVLGGLLVFGVGILIGNS